MAEGGRWLNRTVWGMAWTSLLSDLGHEAQTALLPAFLAALGCPPLALGAVEGVSDAASSFVKLGAGWISDRLPRRKPVVVAGYAATGLASGILALASGWPMVMGGKLFGWCGRGLRGPLRDAMLTDAIPPEARGRAFGFHRAGDTIGAILGPLAVALLLGWTGASLPRLRWVMAGTLLPGLGAAAVMAWIIRESARPVPAPVGLGRALSAMPGPFRRYLGAVAVFGAGDFAPSLLILAAGQLLAPAHGPARAAVLAGLLYAGRNGVYALAAYPAGHLGDRLGRRRILALGYGLAALAPLLLAPAFAGGAGLPLLALAMGLHGLAHGIKDSLESASAADLAPAAQRGLGFGLLAAANGGGDLLSSLAVGALWTLRPALGFGWAAGLMGAGALLVLALPGSAVADP